MSEKFLTNTVILPQPSSEQPSNRNYSELEYHKKLRDNKKCSKKHINDNYIQTKLSILPGIKNIFQKDSNIYERFFWLLAIVSALLGCLYVCLTISKRFHAANLETIIDTTNMPVYLIHFPVITVCNENNLNWQRLEAAKKLFLPQQTSVETRRLFELVIGSFDNIGFGKFDVFKVLKNQPLDLVSHINFSLVFDFMTWKCEEFLNLCTWSHRATNCCDIFVKSQSRLGLCYSFNTWATEHAIRQRKIDSKYPWRTGGAGPKSGLTFRVMLNTDKQYNKDNEKGIKVMISEPVLWYREPHFVTANTMTLIEIEPIIYSYDNNTRRLSADQRGCVFNDEYTNYDFESLSSYTFLIENCQSACREEYLNRYCNCSMDLLFPPGRFTPCKVTDLPCLADNNDYFLYDYVPDIENYIYNTYKGMYCKCFRNCYSIGYLSDVKSKFVPAPERANETYIDLDIHYRLDTILAYRTRLVFDWIDLVVSFGGIAGLFLGCSLISAFELLYFAVVDLPLFTYRKFKTKENLKRINPQEAENNKSYNYQYKRKYYGSKHHISSSNKSKMMVTNFQNYENFDNKNISEKIPDKDELIRKWTYEYYLTNKHKF